MAKRSRCLPLVAIVAIGASLGGCATFPGRQVATLDERECMARVMFFESNRSSEDGMLAVGTVVMNRLQSPKYPKTVCAVVGQEKQFADGALSKPVGTRSWPRALKVADSVLAGERHSGVGNALFFHTAGYSYPYRNMRYVTLAGGNIFYEKRYPAPGAPAWPSSTLFASAATRPSVGSRPVMLAQADEDDAVAERPRAAPAARARPIALARMEESAIERPYATSVAARPRPVVLARAEEPATERPSAAVEVAARPRREAMPAVVASAPKRETAGPLVLASAPVRAAAPIPAKPHPVVAITAVAPPAKPKPIVLAMLSEPKARSGTPRSIADLIAMDVKRR